MAYVAMAAKSYLNTSVGTGQCVPLVEAATGAPRDATWSRGKHVKGATDIAVGTAIASFDPNGRYGNHTDGRSHAAVYMGQNDKGIQVIDQWVSVVHGHREVQMAHERTLSFRTASAKEAMTETSSMLSNKTAAVAMLLALAACGRALAATSCPAYNGEHALAQAQLFDGPPADKVDLETQDGTWDLSPYKDTHHRYFLVCHFSRSAKTKTVSLPAGVSACRTTIHAGATQVACD